jgi:hypothetical protein
VYRYCVAYVKVSKRVYYRCIVLSSVFRHIFVLTNTGDIMTFDFWESSPVTQPPPTA